MTSIGPGREHRIRRCLESWSKCGGEIIAVQPPGDEAFIAERFACVTVHIDSRTGESLGRPRNPRLAAMLSLAESGPILLINSDIEIKDDPSSFWDAWRPLSDKLLVGVRYDVDGDNVSLNPYGIDAFLITPEMVPFLRNDLGFCFGFPGWDYWIPFQLHYNGFMTKRVHSVLHHEVHSQGYSRDAVAMAQSILSNHYGVHRRKITQWIQRATDRPVSGAKRKR